MTPPRTSRRRFHIIPGVMLWSWLVFLIVLVGTGLLLSAILIVLMALTLLRPYRMTDAKATMVLQRLSPGDLHLKFEELKCPIRDERTGKPWQLAAWWIPAEHVSTRTALLIHGYADAKVGAIAWAPTLHALGWNVLAIDLRAHGESPGQFSTAGYWERHDLTQVINQLRAQRPRETETLVLYGISLGAAVAIASAALRETESGGGDGDTGDTGDTVNTRDAGDTGDTGSTDVAGSGDSPGNGGDLRGGGGGSDIDAVIMESPFADYRRAVAAHGAMRGMPGGVMRDAAVRLAEWLADADFRAVRPMDLLQRVSCPVMIIHSGDDPFIPDDDAATLKRAFEQRADPRHPRAPRDPRDPRDAYWSIPDAGHVLGLAAVGANEYRQRLANFLNAIPSATSPAPPPTASTVTSLASSGDA